MNVEFSVKISVLKSLQLKRVVVLSLLDSKASAKLNGFILFDSYKMCFRESRGFVF